MINRSIVSVVLLFISSSIFAASNANEGLADQVLAKAGLYEMIASFPEQMNAQAAQQSPFSTNPETTQKAINVLVSSFDEHQAKAYMLEYALKNTTSDELKQMHDWLSSALGARFIASEIETASVEGQSNLMRYAADLNSNPPSQQRIALIQEFEQKAMLTENVMDMMKTMMIGMANGINSVAPESERLSAEEAEAKMTEVIGNMIPLMEKMMWQQMLLIAHYSYRDYSEGEIREYISFLQGDVGQKYIGLSKGAGEVFGRIMSGALADIVKDSEHKK